MIKKLDPISSFTTFDDSMVSVDPSLFEHNVDVAPFRLKHQLTEHPLFQLGSLVELAKRLPHDQREYVFAKQEFGSHDDLDEYKHAADNDELSTEELINGISDQNIVIVLRNVESDPQYGDFVNQCLDSLSRSVENAAGKISGRESFIFVSPPDAYTPYHYDPEQNFFMQVRGQKQFAVYDVADRSILPEHALEKYYGQGQLITKCDDDQFGNHRVFDLSPGDGIYVPVTAPHWVRTLDEISISVSINFRTPSSIRRDRVYRCNRMLRKLGLNPSPVSLKADRWNDRMKAGVLGIPATLKRVIGK